ncbi:MAG: DUF6064 family protein, partial [Acidobacteriota bacterium]
AAVYFAWAFGLEAALLIGFGGGGIGPTFERRADRASRAGLAIFLFALAAELVAAPLLGRGWKAVEIVGTAPDPNAIGTLGLLLIARGRGRGWLMVLPATWCAVSGFTLLAMKSSAAWIPSLAALLAIVLAVSQTHARRRGKPSLATGAPV